MTTGHFDFRWAPRIFVAGLSCLMVGGCATKPSPEATLKENVGPGQWTSRAQNAVSFALERSFGDESGPVESLLTRPASVSTDSDQNVYVYDWGAGRIVSFDSAGVFRWTTYGPGSGPGELENASDLIQFRDTLYITNIAGTRIDRFSTDGQFVDSTPMREFGRQSGRLLGFESHHVAVITGQIGTRVGSEITLFDVAADSVRTRILAEAPELDGAPVRTLAKPVNWSGGIVTTGGLASYRHEYYSAEGRLLRTVTRDVPIVGPSITERGIRNYSGVYAPIRISNKYWISTASWPINVNDVVTYENMEPAKRPPLEFRSTIDLFDDSGTLMWSRLIQDGEQSPFRSVAHVSSDGRIFTIQDGRVDRLRIEIREPT